MDLTLGLGLGLGLMSIVFSWLLPPEEGSYKSILPNRSEVSTIKRVDQRLQTCEL